MSVGEKIRGARTSAGMTQEELAARLCVSRQAITKWESDRGLPDIENLKALGSLFGLSIDRLLSDEQVSAYIVREPITLADHTPSGTQRDRYDAAVRARYPDATTIQPLVRRKKLSRWESVLDFIVQPGILGLADSVNRYGGNYAVDLDGGEHLLVAVTTDFLEIRELNGPFLQRKQVIGQDVFVKAPYTI